MAYLDGFVIAVPTANRDKFIAHAEGADTVFTDLGATRVVECWDDNVPAGHTTDFRRAVKCEEGEKIVFSWVTWDDKETADASHEKMMADPRMAENFGAADGSDMPFDGKRMIYGGFEPLAWKEA